MRRDLESKAVYLDQRKKNMPYEYPNIGSIFRNPEGMSAGKLLDDAGAKDLFVGDARVSEKHANIIVNTGAATTADIQQLMRQMQQRVQQHVGVILEQEVECLQCL